MKNRIRNFVVGAGVAAVMCAPLLKAQDVLEVANVPFDFHVNQATLPAGAYVVFTHANGQSLQLRNEETGKSILILPPGRDTGKGEPQLTFHRYGNHYFLAEVWAPGATGYIMKKSSLERELEKGDARPTFAYVPMVRQ